MIAGISPAAEAVRRIVARRRASAAPFALALLYHRIAKVAHDPWALAVSPGNFAGHLAVLRRSGPCLRLGAALEALSGERPPRATVCVTFDDGYRDNVRTALPLLEEANVPATVFVTSGAVGSASEFWWDALTRLWLSAEKLPPRLSVQIAGTIVDLEPGERGSTLRRRGFDRLRRSIRTLPPSRISEALDRIAEWSGQDRHGAREDHPVDAAELKRLAASPLIEIGGHTLSHPRLPALPPDEAAREIGEGRRRLADLTGQPVRGFAYPFGANDARVASLVRKAGFAYAATVASGVATRTTPPYRIPRLQVGNWTPDVFEARLRAYAGGIADLQARQG